MRNTHHGKWTQTYYAAQPKVYKYNSDYAKFDLGLTGAIYYPARYYPNRSNDPPVFIDFAHEDFFFTEDNKKKLSDMQ